MNAAQSPTITGAVVGLALLDHLILTDSEHYSFAERGAL